MADAADPGTPDEAVADLTYEQARDELIAVVQKLESGGIPLQESVELWERGEALARVCERFLDGARARLDAAIRADDDTTDDE